MDNLFDAIPPEFRRKSSRFSSRPIISAWSASSPPARPRHPGSGTTRTTTSGWRSCLGLPGCASRMKPNPGCSHRGTTCSSRPTAATGWSGPTRRPPPCGWRCITPDEMCSCEFETSAKNICHPERSAGSRFPRSYEILGRSALRMTGKGTLSEAIAIRNKT